MVEGALSRTTEQVWAAPRDRSTRKRGCSLTCEGALPGGFLSCVRAVLEFLTVYCHSDADAKGKPKDAQTTSSHASKVMLEIL